MDISSKTKKLLAGVTAVGVLTLGGGTAAFAAGTGSGSSGSSTSAATANGVRRRTLVRAALRTAFQSAANTLGMSARDLWTQMKNGPQSLAAVAGDKTDAVRSGIVSALTDKINQAVASGKLSSDRAAKLESRLPQAVDRLMNRVPGQHALQ